MPHGKGKIARAKGSDRSQLPSDAAAWLQKFGTRKQKMKFLQRKSTKHSRRVAVAGDASATATGVVGASQEEDDNLLEGLNSEGDADNDYDDEMEEPEEEESPANGPVAGATAAVDTAGARSVKKLHAWV
jgi:hypothetical protein